MERWLRFGNDPEDIPIICSIYTVSGKNGTNNILGITLNKVQQIFTTSGIIHVQSINQSRL